MDMGYSKNCSTRVSECLTDKNARSISDTQRSKENIKFKMSSLKMAHFFGIPPMSCLNVVVLKYSIFNPTILNGFSSNILLPELFTKYTEGIFFTCEYFMFPLQSLFNTGNCDIASAVEWIIEHQGDADVEIPLSVRWHADYLHYNCKQRYLCFWFSSIYSDKTLRTLQIPPSCYIPWGYFLANTSLRTTN